MKGVRQFFKFSMCLVILSLGCTTKPSTPSAPKLPKFTFPRVVPGVNQTLDQPIPIGKELEYVVPIEQSTVAAKNLDRVFVEVTAADQNRTLLQSGQLTKGTTEGGVTTFFGNMGPVSEYRAAKVIITARGGEKLSEFDVRIDDN